MRAAGTQPAYPERALGGTAVIFDYMLSHAPVFLAVMSVVLLTLYGLGRLLRRVFGTGHGRASRFNPPKDRR